MQNKLVYGFENYLNLSNLTTGSIKLRRIYVREDPPIFYNYMATSIGNGRLVTEIKNNTILFFFFFLHICQYD